MTFLTTYLMPPSPVYTLRAVLANIRRPLLQAACRQI